MADRPCTSLGRCMLSKLPGTVLLPCSEVFSAVVASTVHCWNQSSKEEELVCIRLETFPVIQRDAYGRRRPSEEGLIRTRNSAKENAESIGDFLFILQLGDPKKFSRVEKRIFRGRSLFYSLVSVTMAHGEKTTS